MRACIVCGQPLDGREPWWLVEPPDRGEHDRCRDWSRRAYPFGDELRRLRGAARALGRLQRELLTTGWLLARAQRRWPDDAAQAVRAGRAALARLRQAFDRFLGGGNPLSRG